MGLKYIFENSDQLIKNWLQNKNTIEFFGIWERLNNPDFNLVEFHQIKENVGLKRRNKTHNKSGSFINAYTT